MNILILGHRSFAAKGLRSLLGSQGHQVTCFSRGMAARSAHEVSGPILEMAANPAFAPQYDTVINYIVLKDEGIAPNMAFMQALLEFCRLKKVQHLIHISSISSYQTDVELINESAPAESAPEKKGSYGALKAAQDLVLVNPMPDQLKITLIRPGFILAPGVVSPIVGMAARLPWGRLLIIGNKRGQVPLISRALVNQAVARAVINPPGDSPVVLLLVAPNSPIRTEYMQVCCRELGMAKGVSTWPVFVWLSLGVAAEVACRLLGKAAMKPYAKIQSRCVAQQFDAAQTQQRLGLNFQFNWQAELKLALDRQAANFHQPKPALNLPGPFAGPVNFIGFGKIVKQRYLPAFKNIGFSGAIRALDLRAGVDPDTGIHLEALASAPLRDACLHVVATPGRAHADAIQCLASVRGPVLVEKPLCYEESELRQWQAFAGARPDAVYVCHNYRLKHNAQALLAWLQVYNPGEIRCAQVHFQSPPVANDSVVWRRAERQARTLLMDYAIHFMDLACMFNRSAWRVNACECHLDARGDTSVITGHVQADYPVSFHLRQGFAPRRASILFDFQNYSLELGFFPDIFIPRMADDSPWPHWQAGNASFGALFTKVKDRLTGRESDQSHLLAVKSAWSALPRGHSNALPTVSEVGPFYQLMFALSERVYGGDNQ